MKRRFPNSTIRQFHMGEAFSFPPAAFSVEPAKSRKLANRVADSERFHAGKLATDLEKHYL